MRLDWRKLNKEIHRRKMPPPPDRLITDDRIDRAFLLLGFAVEEAFTTNHEAVVAAFLFAIGEGTRKAVALQSASVMINERFSPQPMQGFARSMG